MRKGFPNHLPSKKRKELKRVLDIIKMFPMVDKILLFGSHARGDWVEDVYSEDNTVYEYFSDFDILVITGEQNEDDEIKLLYEIEERIKRDKTIFTPISVIVENVFHVNEQLEKSRYFYVDIFKEGYIIYDNKKQTLIQNFKKLTNKEKQKIAKEDYKLWMNKAQTAIENYKFNLIKATKTKTSIKKEFLNKAAFEMHQATEAMFVAVLLVYTGYKPKTHDLQILESKVVALDPRFTMIFPRNNIAQRQIFSLLRKAYADARYKKIYKITKKQLENIFKNFEILKILTEESCNDKLKQKL